MDALFIKQAEDYLIKQDGVLGQLIKLQRPISLNSRQDYFASLCRSIIGQQISVVAAAAIFSRFEKVTKLSAELTATLNAEQVGFIGLSKQKASYLKDLATYFVNEPGIYDHLDELSDQQVIDDLIKIKGIGVWSAQMFLIFTLGRPDVFAPDDAGLKRAITKVYDLRATPEKTALTELAEKWTPYRTVASMHLWKSLNNEPLT